MYINQIDELFDNIIDKLNEYLIKEDVFKKLLKDVNFVKYNNDILLFIKNYINIIPKDSLNNITKNKENQEIIINIIKRYCAFYLYLGLAYYYNGTRDLFITNIIEISKYQKDATFQIPNFYNSENNSKIIIFYNDIKNILKLVESKSIDTIKIILNNNKLKYASTIELFEQLGNDYIIDNFLIADNFHNIIKTFIIGIIYKQEEKEEIYKLLNQEYKKEVEYKYIDIVVSNEKKIVDFSIIQKFLTFNQLKSGLAEEIYDFLVESKENKEIIIKENKEFINYLFTNEIIIPISEDFLRYHKDTERYDLETNENIKDRDATKIKYVINKTNNVKNYYSTILERNPKLKLEIEKYYYKQIDPRMAILYNNSEEIKIIQKLELYQNVDDYDLLIDLLNIRKYPYNNFKNISKDGIKVRPQKTIEAIRYSNLKDKKKNPLELRISNDSIDINIVGIVFNPSKMPLSCFTIGDLINIQDYDKNGFHAFNKIMTKSIEKSNNKLYYWLFNNQTDIPETSNYINYNANDIERNIKIMLEQIYYNYANLIKDKLKNYIETKKELSLDNLNNIINHYNKTYFNLDLIPNIKNELIENIILNKIPELEIIPDDIDSIIPGKNKKTIKLPVLTLDKYKKNIVVLGQKEIDVSEEMTKRNLPICQHYIKWNNIKKISKNTDVFTQEVFNFIKQYLKTNERGDYICKSCNELLQVRNYVSETYYSEEDDAYIASSITIDQRLEDISKYSKYLRVIRNIDKNIEKFAYSVNLSNYLGNTIVSKLKRKAIIKDIIDLILIHTDTLRINPQSRIENNNKIYGTGLSNLFFFELKDDIFLTSSTDIDKLKLIKYNNIIIYLILLIILELNPGQILNLKEDKKINYFFFEKIGTVLFNNLYLRVSKNEKISLLSKPLLAYIIYYFSGIVVYNRLWLFNDNNDTEKDKQKIYIELHKTVIHTIIDLINTIIEAKFKNDSNFLYGLFYNRINIKIDRLFNDNELLNRIKIMSNSKINIDETTKKITYLSKKINFIDINNEYELGRNQYRECLKQSLILNKKYNKNEINFNSLTICSDGKFHKWVEKGNDLLCSNCNKTYNELMKDNQTSEIADYDYYDKIKLLILNKLSKKYCISGDLHDLDSSGKCIKCKEIPETFKPSDKELKKLESNLEKNQNEYYLEQINKNKKYNERMLKSKEEIKEIINKFIKRYHEISKNNMTNYIDDFIDKLSKIIGDKIKIDNKTIYLKNTVYTINHDYFGNDIKNPIIILESDNKINLIQNHNIFNKDILYYKDKSHNVYVYYDAITLQYLGYSEDNKNIKFTKNDASIKIDLSLRDSIMYLGYENKYINIYHYNKNYIDNLPKILSDKNEILNIIRSRINNLKQIILRIQSIIFNVRFNGIVKSKYNINEKNIISDFTSKLKKFNIKDENNHDSVFKHYKYILTNLYIENNINTPNIKLNNNYLDVNSINNINNTDNKLLFFLIFNLNRLLDYNNNVIKFDIATLIVNTIIYSFNLYYCPYNDYNVRKFDYLLVNEQLNIDESKINGFYNELLSENELNDEERINTINEENYDNKEAFESLDVDDYENQDEADDGFAESFDCMGEEN